ncbi:hypothetical protein ABVK25_011770 [Lepraria finkii]|uniref:Uncharacterized protein n=1 Tax=Lepraria finkii TaxID=1340010 RepID=A0ABR4AL96_9LECA
MEPQNHVSKFLTLLVELRINVYKNNFKSLAEARVIRPLIPSHYTSSARVVSLLSVSQLVDREASETLYGKHTFMLAQFHRRESCNEAITA